MAKQLPGSAPDGARRRNGFDRKAWLTLAAMALGAVVLSSIGGEEESAPAVPKLSAAQVAQCRELLAKGEEAGVIKGRPKPTRIDVEDSLWAALPADTKDQLLRAVACDVWQTATLPGGFNDFVVAYGYRSGERVQMYSSAGMSRD